MTNTDNRPIVSEVTPLCRQMAPYFKAWAEEIGNHVPGLIETFTGGFTARDAEMAAWEKWAEHVESLVVHLYKVGLVGTDGSCAACVDIIAILDSAYGQPATGRTACPTCQGAGTVVERGQRCAECGGLTYVTPSGHVLGCKH